jgi:hypothetical protein
LAKYHFSICVKAIVLVLGAGGLATMWEAVFADVGVALLAILNAVRIQKMKFYFSPSISKACATTVCFISLNTFLKQRHLLCFR